MAEASVKLGRVSLVPRGAYDAAAVYKKLDVVEHEGSSYLVLADGTTGVTPEDGGAYMLLAEKGEKGDKGDTGPAGPQGPQGMGLTIAGQYATPEELAAAVPAPEPASAPAEDPYSRIETILDAVPKNASEYMRSNAVNLVTSMFTDYVVRRLGRGGARPAPSARRPAMTDEPS